MMAKCARSWTSRWHRLSAIVVAMAMTAGSVSAAAVPIVAACHACHGTDGISVSQDIPNLAGQKESYLRKQLRAFRAGERRNDLMNGVAGALSDDDIDALAKHWSEVRDANPHEASAIAAIASDATFPPGFPDGFSIYQVAFSKDGSSLVRRYANRVAMEAARDGNRLPDGSVIVQVSYAAKLDAQGEMVRDDEGTVVAGEVKGYSSMRSVPGFEASVPMPLRNGGWSYGLFSNDRKPRIGVNQAACLACHRPLEADDFVFTRNVLHAAAVKMPARE